MLGFDWKTGRADAKRRDLLEAVEEENFERFVRFSTYIKGNVFDLVIANCSDKV
jgi:hypothetical protein